MVECTKLGQAQQLEQKSQLCSGSGMIEVSSSGESGVDVFHVKDPEKIKWWLVTGESQDLKYDKTCNEFAICFLWYKLQAELQANENFNVGIFYTEF